MDKASRHILIGVLVLIFFSIMLTYNRTIIQKDYLIFSEEGVVAERSKESSNVIVRTEEIPGSGTNNILEGAR